MMKKILLSSVAILVIMAVVLTGCGKQTSADPNTANKGSNTLEKVISAKKVRVGVLTDFAPWGSRNAQGQIEGYDIDLANRLAKALGVEAEIIPVEAPNRVPSLASDKVDVLIACITPTDERAKAIDFTIPYASAGLIPMVWAENNDIKSYQDLAGKKVSLVRGGVPDVGTSQAVPKAELVRFDTIADAFTAFQTKKVDAFVEEDTFVFFQVKKDSRFKAVGEAFSRELISFGVKKNDQEWLNYLNNFLTNLRYTGENAKFYEKWFGHTPAPLTLN